MVNNPDTDSAYSFRLHIREKSYKIMEWVLDTKQAAIIAMDVMVSLRSV